MEPTRTGDANIYWVFIMFPGTKLSPLPACSLNLHNNSIYYLLYYCYCPFHKWENGCSDKLGNMPETTQAGLSPHLKRDCWAQWWPIRKILWGYRPPKEAFQVGIFCGIRNIINYVLGRDVMHTIINIINTAVCYTWKLLTEEILRVSSQGKKLFFLFL